MHLLLLLLLAAVSAAQAQTAPDGDEGIVFKWIYTNDLLSNVAGGRKRGTIDQGKFEGIWSIDLEKFAGLRDWTAYSNAFQIHNSGRIRRDYVGGLNTIAAIEAVPTLRLSELWLERRLAGGAASFRFGQLAADSEFFFSELSDMFLQSDWPTIAAVNLPSGGPAYPLSTPGMRLKIEATRDISLLLAIFNGDPAGPPRPTRADEQIRNHNGLNFRLRDPPLIIGETQIRWNQREDAAGLAGTLKLGVWTHAGKFDDQRFANDGSLLANPAGSGVPAQHRGNFGIYGVVDQQVYRTQGGGTDKGIFLFSRASVSPSDRNLISGYIDGGIVFAGLIPRRPEDRFGASIIYSRFSERARAFDRDQAALTGPARPARDYEANLELTYVAQAAPGWTIQPNLQYIWHPSGQQGRNARVVGVRSKWSY
jgi:porin